MVDKKESDLKSHQDAYRDTRGTEATQDARVSYQCNLRVSYTQFQPPRTPETLQAVSLPPERGFAGDLESCPPIGKQATESSLPPHATYMQEAMVPRS